MMIATDTFTQFGRRMSSTQGYPYVVIADTPNPIRQLDPETLLARVEAMLPVIVEGLTQPPAEIERRLKDVAKKQIHPEGVVRSSVPV
ncbi:MAG: hypothetical protein HY322_07700 [Betaproteobacteria bacterium]|nr:hypothetical protein [Betaproteobacteria bacterium]